MLLLQDDYGIDKMGCREIQKTCRYQDVEGGVMSLIELHAIEKAAPLGTTHKGGRIRRKKGGRKAVLSFLEQKIAPIWHAPLVCAPLWWGVWDEAARRNGRMQ